jgi:hypothetical protein
MKLDKKIVECKAEMQKKQAEIDAKLDLLLSQLGR